MIKMGRYNKKTLAQIKEQISILDIADEYGLTVKKQSRNIYTLVEHDSVKIYPDTNSFFRYATRVGGDVLKFMEEIPEIGYSFSKAYEALSKRINRSKEVKKTEKKDRQIDPYKTYMLPLNEKKERALNLMRQLNPDDNQRYAIAYLVQTRKLDYSVVMDVIKKGYIKQVTDTLYRNKTTLEVMKRQNLPKGISEEEVNRGYDKFDMKSVCFLGYDENGMIATACRRACLSNSTFKGDLEGCDYSYGWLYDPAVDVKLVYLNDKAYDPNKKLYCFESYIDMLSFISIQKQQGIDYSQNAYLSCASATKYPTVLATVDRLGYHDVVICFDNDKAGHDLGEELKNNLLERGVEVDFQYSKEKDWNEEIKVIHEKRGIKDRKEEAVAKLKKQPIQKKVQKKEITR